VEGPAAAAAGAVRLRVIARARRRGLLGVVGLAAGVALAAGTTTAGGAARIATAEQVARGRAVFEARCAKCHGADGQGTSEAPRLIGQPNGLSGYRTAKGLFDFVSSDMPFDAPGTLTPQEYWDVLAFLLDGNRVIGPDVTLGPDTAEGIRLEP
jgi:cytochrome c